MAHENLDLPDSIMRPKQAEFKIFPERAGKPSLDAGTANMIASVCSTYAGIRRIDNQENQ